MALGLRRGIDNIGQMPYVALMPKVDLLPTAAVARRLGMDVRTVHRLVKRGQLVPVIKGEGIRGAYFFDARDIDRLDTEAAS